MCHDATLSTGQHSYLTDGGGGSSTDKLGFTNIFAIPTLGVAKVLAIPTW